MANITKKFRAQELRKRGYSIGEIAKKLGMDKSDKLL
jgi:hypothetical protein